MKTVQLEKATVEVGLLLRPAFRKYLEDQAFEDGVTTYTEGSGWLVRTFYIRSTPEALTRMKEQMERVIHD